MEKPPLAFALEVVALSALLPSSLFASIDDLRPRQNPQREAIRVAALHLAACVQGFAFEEPPAFEVRDLLAPLPAYFEAPTNHKQVVGAAEIRDSWRKVALLAKQLEQPLPLVGLSDPLREWLFYNHPHLKPEFIVLEMERLAGAALSDALAGFNNLTRSN